MKHFLQAATLSSQPETLNSAIDAYLLKLKDVKDYTYFREYGLVDIVNSLLHHNAQNVSTCKSLYRLIGITSKSKDAQIVYAINTDILDNFDKILEDMDVLV